MERQSQTFFSAGFLAYDCDFRQSSMGLAVRTYIFFIEE
jgi:hypothetical protein